MISLTDGATLYHGSYCEVSSIDLSRCAHGRGFGRGFYVTSSIDQAKSFVSLSVRKRYFGQEPMPKGGFISLYTFESAPGVLSYELDGASVEWLHFVSANRRGGLFLDVVEEMSKYDIIVG